METQKKDEVVVKKNNKFAAPAIISIIAVLAVVAAVIIALTINSSGKDRKLQEQLDLGEKYISELDYEQAIVSYELAIEIDPMCVEAYLGLIDAYVGMEDYDKALEYAGIGYEKTQDQRLSEQMTAIENSEEYVNCRLEKEAESLGLQVTEIGMDKLAEYYAYTGGVIITTSDGLYGAMNSDGEIIVPNEYTECEQVANDEGHFILTKDDIYYVFDRDGKVAYNAPIYAQEIEGDWIYEDAPHSIFVQDGYVVYQGQDGPDGNFKPVVYDLNRQIELSVADYEATYNTSESSTDTGNYGIIGTGNGMTVSKLTPGEAWYTDIVDGYLVGYQMEFSVVGARKIQGDNVDIPVFNDMQEEGLSSGWPGGSVTSVKDGYAFFHINETYFDDMYSSGYWICCGLVPIISENGKASAINLNQIAEEFHGIPKEQGYFPWGAHTYWTQGGNRVNLDQQVVVYLGEEPGRKLYLLNFENAQTDEYGYVNPSDVVIGSYDYIELNDSGNYLACNGDDWFYVNSKGEIVADFKDCSDFWNGYALIIDEDNLAYIINTEFEKMSAGYPADSVYLYGEALALENDGKITLLMP